MTDNINLSLMEQGKSRHSTIVTREINLLLKPFPLVLNELYFIKVACLHLQAEAFILQFNLLHIGDAHSEASLGVPRIFVGTRLLNVGIFHNELQMEMLKSGIYPLEPMEPVGKG